MGVRTCLQGSFYVHGGPARRTGTQRTEAGPAPLLVRTRTKALSEDQRPGQEEARQDEPQGRHTALTTCTGPPLQTGPQV